MNRVCGRLVCAAMVATISVVTPLRGQVQCEAPRTIGPLPDALVEASGIVRDPRTPDVLWLHNDSGHHPNLYAIDKGGRLLGRAPLVDLPGVDVEDIALGRCEAGECMYLADIGDNVGFRPFVAVFQLPLPALPDDGPRARGDDPAELPAVSPLATLTLRYPDGPQDAESLAIDDERGQIVVLSKGRSGEVRMYAGDLDAGDGDEGPQMLTFHGVLNIPTSLGISHQATAADLSPGGDLLAVRTYVTLYFLPWKGADAFDPGRDLESLDLRPLNEPQGEGLAFDVSGKRLYLASEGQRDRPPLLSTVECGPGQ